MHVEPLDEEIEPVVRKLLGLELDLPPFLEFAQGDAVLAGAVRLLPGFRPPLAPDPFEALVPRLPRNRSRCTLRSRCAAGSSTASASRRARRCVPDPRTRRDGDGDELTALGFSRRKAEYVLGLARADLDFDELSTLPDDDVKARLTSLRGLGEWSADWFLARHLARPEAWPAGDLGLRKAVLAFYPEMTDVRAAGFRFHPFQNLSAHYLLAALRYR